MKELTLEALSKMTKLINKGVVDKILKSEMGYCVLQLHRFDCGYYIEVILTNNYIRHKKVKKTNYYVLEISRVRNLLIKN